MESEGLKKRLENIEWSKNHGYTFTKKELELAERRAINNAGGTGGGSPPVLDINSISAPVSKVSACLNPSWVAIRCHHGNETNIRVRCRKCTGCMHAWRSKVRHMILDGSYADVWMWTLTIPEKPDINGYIGDKEAFDVIQERWHDLLRKANKLRIQFEYFRVVELQKRGTPHFHVAVKEVTRRGVSMPDTKSIYRMFRRLQRKTGFGFQSGKTTDFQKARLGGAGVASYMAKYMKKGESYNELRRDDGRAIRRYCRSRKWISGKSRNSLRYSRVGTGVKKSYQTECELPCVCGEKKLLNRQQQIEKWIKAIRREGKWVAPMEVLDIIIKNEREVHEQWQN